jgi:hypothetical protein
LKSAPLPKPKFSQKSDRPKSSSLSPCLFSFIRLFV